jgi:hypothetical protein
MAGGLGSFEPGPINLGPDRRAMNSADVIADRRQPDYREADEKHPRPRDRRVSIGVPRRASGEPDDYIQSVTASLGSTMWSIIRRRTSGP